MPEGNVCVCVCVHGTSQRCTWDGAKYYYNCPMNIMHFITVLDLGLFLIYGVTVTRLGAPSRVREGGEDPGHLKGQPSQAAASSVRTRPLYPPPLMRVILLHLCVSLHRNAVLECHIRAEDGL